MTVNSKTPSEEMKHEEECHCHDEACNCHEEKNESKPCDCDNCDCEKTDNSEEYLLMAKRIQADFDNYRKRTVNELLKARFDGMVSALETILPALDSIEKAQTMIQDASALEGFRLVQNNLLEALKQLGVSPIDAKGKAFNPEFHNALAIVPTCDFEDGTIMQDAQKGYILNGKVIRYSQVVVAKNETK